MRDRLKFEYLVGTNHDELIKLRMGRLKSHEICMNLLKQKKERFDINISDENLQAKAKGMSSAIESALNYLCLETSSLNTKILLRYYALLQLTIAEEVSSLRNESDLLVIQKHTENGHGLATLNKYNNDDISFCNDFFCYILRNGHFYHYLKHLNISNLNSFCYEKRLKKNEVVDNDSHLITLSELFKRIPELYEVIEEYLGEPPLVLRIAHSTRNMSIESKKAKRHMEKTGEFVLQAPPENSEEKITYLSLITNSSSMTIDYIKSLSIPFFDVEEGKQDVLDSGYPICKFKHPNKGHWHNYLPIYKSSYSGSTYIVPIFGKIEDPILIHFMLLYSMSIIVRYLPNVWYELTSGNLNHIGSLIEYYISIFDHIVPQIMLERITEKQMHISMPGGFDAPV